jgi:hypothetical protein
LRIPSTLLSDETVQSVRHSLFDLCRPFNPKELDALMADRHGWQIAKQLKRGVEPTDGNYSVLEAEIRSCIRLTDQRICCAACEADLLGRISYAGSSRQKRIWRRVRTALNRQLNQITIMSVRQQSHLHCVQT